MSSAAPVSAPANPLIAVAFSGIGHGFSHYFMLIYPTAVLALQQAWQASYAELIVLAWWGQLLFGAAALPAGWLGDRWSAAGMMVLFFLGIGAGAIWAGLARSPLELTLALAVIGAFAAIYHPVGIAWLVRNAVHRGKALGINGVFGSVGIGIAAPATAALGAAFGWRWAFIAPGIVAVITGLAMLACLQTGRMSLRQGGDVNPQREPSRADARRAFIVLSVTMLCVGLINNTGINALPKLVEENFAPLLGGALIGPSVLVGAAFVFTALAQIWGGHLADKFPQKSVYIGLYLVQVPLLLLAAVIANPYGLYGLAVVTLTLQSASLSTENALLAKFTPSDWRATAFGAKFVLALGLSSLGTLLLGWIHAQYGAVQPIYYFYALFAVLVAAAGALLPRQRV